MLQELVVKLAKQPSLMEKFKEDNLGIVGISEIEKAAILDVLANQQGQGFEVKNSYWQ